MSFLVGPPGLGRRKQYQSPAKLARCRSRMASFIDSRSIRTRPISEDLSGVSSKTSLSKTKRRVVLRRGALLRRMSAILSALVNMVESVRVMDSPFGRFVDALVYGCPMRSEQYCGDLLPMPPIMPGSFCRDIVGVDQNALVVLTNFTISALNFLCGGLRAVSVPCFATSTQGEAQHRLLSKWLGIVRHSGRSNALLEGVKHPMLFLNESMSTTGVPLVASMVDGLGECGCVDPGPLLPRDAFNLFNDAALFFPEGTVDIPRTVRGMPSAQNEYAELVRRQLRSHRVALMRNPQCSTTTFTVAKSGTGRLRKVWSGEAINYAACVPFAPRWLADPAALATLEATADRPLYLSTRDGACLYDQLRLPPNLIGYFGRPQIQVADLCNDELPIWDVHGLIIDNADMQVYAFDWITLVCLTWPMGFAHSSFVAQEVMTATCLHAGFTPDQFITGAGNILKDSNVCISVANAFTRFSKDELAFATDAAPSYGFGMARASCDPQLSRRLASACFIDGHGFIPRGVDVETASVKAVNTRIEMPLWYDDFIPQLSVRARVDDDAPTLEATAVT